MPALADLQDDFVMALRNASAAPPATLVGRGDEQPVQRFNVYRNNVHVSLVEAITATYPTVERLVGEAFFRAMARAFVGQALPRTPVLINYGGDFPAFIAGFAPARGLPYLGDVARLDWAWHQAYHAADALAMDPQLLAGVAPERGGELVFTLHPSAQVLASGWPMVSIWMTNRYDHRVRRIDLADGGETALVCRPALQVGVCRLPPGTDRLMAAIRRGAPLARAVDAATAEEPGFELATALQALLAGGAFTNYRL